MPMGGGLIGFSARDEPPPACLLGALWFMMCGGTDRPIGGTKMDEKTAASIAGYSTGVGMWADAIGDYVNTIAEAVARLAGDVVRLDGEMAELRDEILQLQGDTRHAFAKLGARF